jgi:hypothetical protein
VVAPILHEAVGMLVFVFFATASLLGASRKVGKAHHAKYVKRHQERGKGFSHDHSPIDINSAVA